VAPVAEAAASEDWEHGICPATGRDYWYNEKKGESVYEDPTAHASVE
jgi:hypothetical protein